MNIKYDSNKINKGDIFIALKTNNDGHKYVMDAINKGASKVVVEYGEYDVETIRVSDTKKYLVDYLYDNYYDEIKDLKLIGITGTNGKTTTSMLIHNMLNKLGIKCGYIGTNGFYIDKFIRELPNTTPEIIDIYELLIECKQNNCKYVCLETSSHGLVQDRLGKLEFDYGVFTNLTHEHLGYHKTMDNYARAKRILFEMLRDKKYAIINNDDSYKDYFKLDINNNLLYGFNDCEYQIINYNINVNGSNFIVRYDNIDYKFEIQLLGKHNIYNALVAIIILSKIGISFDEIRRVLMNIESPIGRMDAIDYKDNKIIVDYAHTPDGIEKVLKAVKEIMPNKVITVIGCGGGKGSDRAKRSEMGNLVLSLSDYVIFTNDNPRDEDPKQIVNDLLSKRISNNYGIELDRKKAIEMGIKMLDKNDILMILGKGHENVQIIGSKKIHFNDKEVVLEILGSDIL